MPPERTKGPSLLWPPVSLLSSLLGLDPPGALHALASGTHLQILRDIKGDLTADSLPLLCTQTKLLDFYPSDRGSSRVSANKLQGISMKSRLHRGTAARKSLKKINLPV